MNLLPVLYSLPLLSAAVMATALTLYAWRRRTVAGARPFVVMMLALAVWSSADAMLMLADDHATKLLWLKIEYIGIVLVAPAWLVYALYYSGRHHWLRRRWLALLAVEPVVMLALVWTNEAHRLVYGDHWVDTTSSFPALHSTYHSGFWVHAAFSYVLLLAGTIILGAISFRSRRLYWQQGMALLAAAFMPWLANALYLLKLIPVPGLDPTPSALAISGLILAWSLFRFNILKIIPIARGAIVEGMNEAVFVLDPENRVVDINGVGARIVGRPVKAIVGRPADEVFAARPELVRDYSAPEWASSKITLSEGDACRHYDLRVSDLRHPSGQLAGRLLVMRDITAREQAEEALRHSEKQFRALIENTHEVITILLADGSIRYQSPSSGRIFGYHPEAMVGQSVLALVHPEDLPAVQAMFTDLVQIPGHIRTSELRFRHADGSWRVVEATSCSLLHEPAVAGIVVNSRDITERKQVEAKLQYQALHDALTGLANRTHFRHCVQQALTAA